MRHATAQRSYVDSVAVLSRHGISRARSSTSHRSGFTLIEVIVAMAILLIVIVSVLMLTTVSASSLKDSEMRDMAKNIATYTVEYLRSRNVTSDNNFIATSSWFNETTGTGTFPGLVDLGGSQTEAVETNSSVAALTVNMHPATPDQNFSSLPAAFYSSLQGYVSLANNPRDADPSTEDGNAKVDGGKYYDDRNTGPPYIVRFPGSSSSSSAIRNFTALANYNGMIYSSIANYDPHYTSTKAGTMAYRGFRVLTQIVARATEDPNNLGHALPHVQYYDVQVTVFWILGSAEHSYSLSTQITTYGV